MLLRVYIQIISATGSGWLCVPLDIYIYIYISIYLSLFIISLFMFFIHVPPFTTIRSFILYLLSSHSDERGVY